MKTQIAADADFYDDISYVDDEDVDLATIDAEYPIDWARIAREAEERVAEMKRGNFISEDEDRIIRQNLRREISARILAQDRELALV